MVGIDPKTAELLQTTFEMSDHMEVLEFCNKIITCDKMPMDMAIFCILVLHDLKAAVDERQRSDHRLEPQHAETLSKYLMSAIVEISQEFRRSRRNYE